MIHFRIDNRLVHGQVIETWLPYLDAGRLVVVNDALADDMLQQQIMQLAIPGRIAVTFIPVGQARALFDSLISSAASTLFLVSSCRDIMRMVEQGVGVPVLNVGNIHYGEGKQQVCAHVALSEDDRRCLDFLRLHGTRLDFRCVPTDIPDIEDW